MPKLSTELIAAVVVAAVVLLLAAVLLKTSGARRIRRTVSGKRFVDYRSFEKSWITEKSGNKGVSGLKYSDGAGCYVILVFDNPVLNGNYSRFENIYIGQSVNVCRRVHSHFNGNGNGDIYADIKYGKYVYVQLLMCRKKDMNELERKLIEAFGATASYNVTKGGGIRR